MARGDLQLLTPATLIAATKDVHDGSGLWLRFPRKGGTPAFVFRYQGRDGKRHDLSCGQAARGSVEAAAESLNKARAAHTLARAQLATGIDPLDEKRKRDAEQNRERNEAKAAKAAKKAAAVTLRRFARDYHAKEVEPVRSTKHGKQWLASIEGPLDEKRTPQQRRQRKLLDALLDRPIDAIEDGELLEALKPLAREIPETCSRVYQRLVEIFDHAIRPAKLRTDNPALLIQRQLKKHLKRESENFKALDWREMPDFIERLRKAEGTAARCLEFTILTASRTSEALGCEWDEINLEAKTWRVPARRMKRKDQGDHLVFLSDRAVEILAAQKGQHERFVFPSITGNGKAQSNMAMLSVRDSSPAAWGRFRACECRVTGRQPRYLPSTLFTITGGRDQDSGQADQAAGFGDHVNRFTHAALMTRGQAQAEVRRDGLTSFERIP